jgi:hypothetical protein
MFVVAERLPAARLPTGAALLDEKCFKLLDLSVTRIGVHGVLRAANRTCVVYGRQNRMHIPHAAFAQKYRW